MLDGPSQEASCLLSKHAMWLLHFSNVKPVDEFLGMLDTVQSS